MSFKAFLKQNMQIPANKQVLVSDRFRSEDGTPALWELRAISERENARIKGACTSKKMTKGRMIPEFNSSRYILLLVAASVVCPDLRDAELQKSYGVVGEAELLSEMLLPGEMAILQEQVQEINGFDPEKLEKDVDQVKNS